MSNPSFTVYFRGFPEEVPDEELEAVFAEFGSIVKCFIHKSRSYGMVEFCDTSSCQNAISALNGVPPMNLYLNMVKTQPIDKHNSSMNDHKRSPGVRFNNQSVYDESVTYSDENIYVDENNVRINVLLDPITKEIYVPIRYAQNIRTYVKRTPIDNGLNRNGNLSDDDCATVYSTSSKSHADRKVKYNNSTPHELKIERSFNEDDDAASISGARKGPKKHYGNGFQKRDDSKSRFGNRFSNEANDGAPNFHKKDVSAKSSFGSRFSNDANDGAPNFNKKDVSAKSSFGSRFSNDGNDGASNFNKKDVSAKSSFGSRFSNDGNDGAPNYNKKDVSAKSFGSRFSNAANDGASNFNKKDVSAKSFGSRFSVDARPTDGLNKTDEPPKPFNRRVSDDDKPKFNKKIQSGSGDNQMPKFPKKEFKKSDDDWRARSEVTQEVPKETLPQNTVVKKSPFNNYKPKTNKILYKTVELPKNKYTQVRIEHIVTETVGFAQITDRDSEYEAFLVTVLAHSLQTKVPTTPEVGKICLAKFDDIWFRAIVLTIFPKITVRFIDYGNESVVEGEVLEISPEARDVPAYALCIQLADGAPCKIKNSATMNVKPVKIENEVTIVHVENGIYEKPAVEAPAPVANTSGFVQPTINSSASADSSTSAPASLSGCQQAMMAALKANMTGMFEATIKLSNTKTVAFFLPELLGEEAEKLEHISKSVEDVTSSSFRPKVGELVAAVNEGWNRALILQIDNGFKVAFIDFGTIKTVPDVKPLPDKFKTIPQFSCVVTATDCDLNKINENNDGLSFNITIILKNTIHCTLSSNGEADLCDVTFVLWNPTVEDAPASRPFSRLSKISASSLETVKPIARNKLEPAELKLKNGDDVKIIDENKGYLFVRTKEASEILKRVDKYILEYAPKAPKILEKPVVGQYVAAQYDNVWYRAKVINVKESSAEILYIDYGNEELKPFFSLKQLNEAICEEPCTLIKIKLKGFVEKPFTQKCLTYFANISESNQILKATFQGSDEQGVTLTMKDGRTVTEELLKLDAAPRPKPFQTRKELYMTVKPPGPNDPKVLTLSLDEIPFEEMDVRYMCPISFELNSICVSLNNPEHCHKIQVELLDQMTKYVKHIAPKIPYSPISEEIVLVENKDKWYRAVCLEPENRLGKIIVFFVDYGFNELVTSNEIRQIPAEFVTAEFKTLGNFATINGLPTQLDDKVTERLESLLVPNEIYHVNVLSKDAEGNYRIDFPEILRQLKSENLA